MATVRVVTSHASAPGFRLAGLEVSACSSDTVDHEVGHILREARVSLLLVEEPLLDAISPGVRRLIDRATRPLVIPFPRAEWGPTVAAEERVVAILRRAIGYRVRLR